MKTMYFGALATTILAMAQPAIAYDEIVTPQTFTLNGYETVNGETIAEVTVGWEAYGELNDDRSNAILVTHYFSGTKHAAGRYSEDDAAPGYWDSIIGPGMPLDTDEYYIISSDTLVNLNTGDNRVVTTGPASTNPETGEPYGTDFPVVSIADFVEVQKALLEDLGIQSLHAVVGASMGALQAFEWAERYPDMVERIVPVIGTASADPWLIAWLDVWAAPIRLDPNWNGGDYYGAAAPTDGLSRSLGIVSLHANHWQWADDNFGTSPAAEEADPAAAMDNRFAIEAALAEGGNSRAGSADANHFLYLVKANQLAEVDTATLRMPVLMVYAPTDQVFPEDKIMETAAAIREGGGAVETIPLEGPNGHLNGVLRIDQVGGTIADFLSR